MALLLGMVLLTGLTGCLSDREQTLGEEPVGGATLSRAPDVSYPGGLTVDVRVRVDAPNGAAYVETGFLERVSFNDSWAALSDQGDGRWEGSFTATSTVGIYSVYFYIRDQAGRISVYRYDSNYSSSKYVLRKYNSSTDYSAGNPYFGPEVTSYAVEFAAN